MNENAFDLLLNIYLSQKDAGKEKIKKALIKYFEALGNNNEHTKFYRKKFFEKKIILIFKHTIFNLQQVSTIYY